MGKSNRERRRAKQKKSRERQRRRSGPTQSQAPFEGSIFDTMTDQEIITALIDSGASSCDCGRCPGRPREEVAAILAEEGGEWHRIVDRALFGVLVDAVAQVWPRGWQPAELVRIVRRENSRQAADLVTDVVMAENRHHAAARVAPEWADQVRGLGEPWWGTDIDHTARFIERHGVTRLGHVTTALELIEFLDHLPQIQVLTPPPGTARATSRRLRDQVDPSKLARIRALLAKAEATEFPEEAEALSERAQRLMARHSIDHAALMAESGRVSEVGARRMPLDAPYEDLKVVLLEVVAQANHCRSVWHKNMGMCTVMGFPDQIDMVELLFTSLLVQATTAMRRAGSTRDARGRSTTRSFRSSFLSSFAQRIGERLAESADGEESAALDEYARAGTDLLPVLASRERQVREALAESFPELEMARVSRTTNPSGWRAGRAAADAASLGMGERITTG